MGFDKQTLISYRIKRSQETIDEAKLAIDNNKLHLAANRIYYAGFYIVSALALKDNFFTSKHSQLMGWFNKNYIKSGELPLEIGRIYVNAFGRRQEADYEDMVKFEKEDILDKLSQMNFFIAKINEILQKK